MLLLQFERSLEGEFPSAMKTRAAAALQKILTFQDVRARVEDVSPSAVAPLVELLRQEKAARQTEGQRHGGLEGAPQPRQKRRLQRGATGGEDGKTKEPWTRPRKVLMALKRLVKSAG